MRVRATATHAAGGAAIGQLELACSPAGLCLGFHGVAAVREGYAAGALASGSELTVPWAQVKSAKTSESRLYLELDLPQLPFRRLTLQRFVAGPGVPREELRRRRLILAAGSFALGIVATMGAVSVAPRGTEGNPGLAALSYGLLAGLSCIALGMALDRSFLSRPSGEAATREAFFSDFRQHFPQLILDGEPPRAEASERVFQWPRLLPSGVVGTALILATAALTAFVSAGRMAPESRRMAARVTSPSTPLHQPPPKPVPPPARTPARNAAASALAPADEQPTKREGNANEPESVTVERRCLCDRADSQLWKSPIPKLSALLLERRTIPTKTAIRTQLEIAIVNNSDTPMAEITLHVLFYEENGGERRQTKERPLYFEGPLDPAEAIKWTTEARGTDFELLVPDFGLLGINGDGAARADQFMQLLSANHRPVRLHGARILSFLGDPRAREAALELKDAMRSGEAAYLRRVLMATGDTRVCDVELRHEGQKASVGACVYNAKSSPTDSLGVQINALGGSLDVGHPLADPPSILDSAKWPIHATLGAQSGRYVRLPLPEGFLSRPGSTVEVMADEYALLD